MFLINLLSFLDADNFFFSEARKEILKALPDAGLKGDENNRKQTLDTILLHASPEEEALPTENHISQQILHERKLPVIHNKEKRRPHRKSHGKIGFIELSQAVSRRWRNLPTDKVNFYQNLAKLDKNRFKKALTVYNVQRTKMGLPRVEV